MAIAKAAFETAENQVLDTRLQGLHSMVTYKTVSAQRYQEVRPMQPIATFIDMSKLVPRGFDSRRCGSGSSSIGKVTVRFDADPNRVYTASSIEVSKSTMINNISFLLTAFLDNPGVRMNVWGDDRDSIIRNI